MIRDDNILFYVMLLLVYLAGTLASAGGIGGGGVLVPIFLVLGRFSYYQATVCSSCTLLGNYLAQFIINFRKGHPRVLQRPLIYWHAVLALLPCQLGGSNVGVFLVRILPETPLLFLALVVLIMVIVKTSIKYRHLYNEECTWDQQIDLSALLDDTSNTRTYSDKKADPIRFSEILQPAHDRIPKSNVYSGKDIESITNKSNNDDDSETPLLIRKNTVNTMNQPAQGYPSISPRTTLQYTLSTDNYYKAIMTINNNHHNVDNHHNNNHNNDINSLEKTVIIPYEILFTLLLVFLTYVLFFLLTEFTVNKCSIGYYLLFFAVYPILIIFTYFSIEYLQEKQRQSAVVGGVGRLIIPEEIRSTHSPSSSSSTHNIVHPHTTTTTSLVSPPTSDEDHPIDPTRESETLTRALQEQIRMSSNEHTTTKLFHQLVQEQRRLEIASSRHTAKQTASPVVLVSSAGESSHPCSPESLWEIVDGDIDFRRLGYHIPLMAFFVGTLCSLLGIGGGELMGPLLLSLHILPAVSTATISSMSVITTANNVTHYLVLGVIDNRTMVILAVSLFLIGAAAGTTGRRLALYYSKRYHRNSIFVLMILIILCISVCLLVYDIFTDGQDLSLHSSC